MTTDKKTNLLVTLLIAISLFLVLGTSLWLKRSSRRPHEDYRRTAPQELDETNLISGLLNNIRYRPINRTLPTPNPTPTTYPKTTPNQDLENSTLPDKEFPTPTPPVSPTPRPEPDCLDEPYQICFYDLENTTDPYDHIYHAPVSSATKKTLIDTFDYLQIKPFLLNNFAIVIMENRDYGGMDVGVVMNNRVRQVGVLEDQEQTAVDPDNYQIIQFNRNLNGGDLSAVASHSIGHLVWSTLSQNDQSTYYDLRGITDQIASTTWETTPLEDFAEVFKYVFGDRRQESSLWDIRTQWGDPDAETVNYLQETIAPKFR